MSYRNYVSALLTLPETRALGNTFLFASSYDLFTEYLTETSAAAIFARRLGLGFDAQKEIELYILLDFLAFVPFGRTGRAYLKEKGLGDETQALRYAELLLELAGVSMAEKEKDALCRFFEARSDLTLPIDTVGAASAVRQLADCLFNGILLGKCAGSLGKAKALTLHLRALAEASFAGGGAPLELSPILAALPALPALNEAQTEHLEAAWRSVL